MKILFLILCIYPSLLQSEISLKKGYQYVIDEFISTDSPTHPPLNYSTFRLRMTHNQFFRPLTEDATVIENPLSINVSNIVLTFVSNFNLIPEINYTKYLSSFQDTFIQYNITTLVLEKKSQNSSIHLSQLELTKPFISQSCDLMTSIRLVEFQQDKSEVFFSEIVKKTKTRIEYLVSQFNLQFEIDTIFSYSLIESGLISNSSLIYGIKNLSYEDSSYTNDGKTIRIESSLTVTFEHFFDKGEIIAKTNYLSYNSQNFIVNPFYIVKSEIEVYSVNLDDNFGSILREAMKIFYKQYDF